MATAVSTFKEVECCCELLGLEGLLSQEHTCFGQGAVIEYQQRIWESGICASAIEVPKQSQRLLVH